MKKLLLTTAILCSLSAPALAKRDLEPSALDSRIRTVIYNEFDIIDMVVPYGYQSSIQFGKGEIITDTVFGDSSGLTDGVSASGDTLHIRAESPKISTNLTVITNLRRYNFTIKSRRLENIRADDITYYIKFKYPGDFIKSYGNNGLIPTNIGGSGPADYNFDYEFAGYKGQVPRRAFDDGQFTYFEFGDDVELPAIFLVEQNGTESIVESRTEGRYVIVHRLGQQFTLRQGDEVTCIFNTAYEHNPELDSGSPQEQGNEVITLLKEWGV